MLGHPGDAMCEESTDLSFARFGGSNRLYPVPTPEAQSQVVPEPTTSALLALGLVAMAVGRHR
jgi:hypothetical protein